MRFHSPFRFGANALVGRIKSVQPRITSVSFLENLAITLKSATKALADSAAKIPDWLDDSIVDAKSDVAPKLDSPKGNATVNLPSKMPA